MDFLGLRNLTIIGDALENIKANRGIDLDLESLPLDDPATYELLGRGDTLGVFQLDGGPMRDLLRRMQPTGFEDVVAVHRAVPAGPDGHERPQRLRRPQERPAGDQADPSRARGAARRRSSPRPTA